MQGWWGFVDMGTIIEPYYTTTFKQKAIYKEH
jgi:hypothetical protein